MHNAKRDSSRLIMKKIPIDTHAHISAFKLLFRKALGLVIVKMRDREKRLIFSYVSVLQPLNGHGPVLNTSENNIGP